MYLLSIAVLMVLGPAASMLLELHRVTGAPTAVALRWAVIWIVGARLFLAGIRQILQPRYTATTILGIAHDDSISIVRELGFANLAIGTIGLGSLLWERWTLPAAVAGAIFYGLAGVHHLLSGRRTHLAQIAMLSDFWALIVLVALASASPH